ncbi:Extracellular endo-alpha-(1-_5)-L-arabinanase [termite gut metagenome]|uniref:Extracellular endo-alpha-(1->5)-L-arabinanase n=1 Tax=termite gut metagenome TaxID=433724 RepID=A0A5J4T0I7_9ZZZZ
MTRYFRYCITPLVASFLLLICNGCEENSNNSLDHATLTNLSVTKITATTATLSAIILNDGGSTIVERGFCWSSTEQKPDKKANSVKAEGFATSFEGEIENLNVNTTYYVRAYAINNTGIAYSPVINFTTSADTQLSVAITKVTDITFTDATFTSSISTNGNTEIITIGFCYSPSSNPPTTNDIQVTPIGTPQEFIAQLSGLDSNTKYYVCAYAVTDKNETVYGETNIFITDITEDDRLTAFSPPTYRDDYSSIAQWSQRNYWNLANVHDPTVEKCNDYYYMYTTDASYGNAHEGHGHFPYRRSKDLVNWEFQGMAMEKTPAWVKDTLNNMRTRLNLPIIDNPIYGHWAPVVRKTGNKYRMYYCIVIDNYIKTGKPNTTENFDNSWTERGFIGLMETDDLASNQWVDKGMVVCSSSDRAKDWSRPNQNNWSSYFKWNAIDPSFIITPSGEHWLIYGSWHSGIVALKLNPATGKPDILGEPWDINALPNYGTRIYTRSASSRWQASEAPEIIYNETTGYYYLFLAYDELSVAYNTRVCRSRNIEGPYTDFNNKDVSAGGDCKPILTHPYKFNDHSGWVGISHCCIFKDDNGKWYYSSQGRLPANTNGNAYSNAIMMGHIRTIRWTDDGWPIVMPERYAAVPDAEIKESELVGTWESITLSYNSGRQMSPQTLTLTNDMKASGANISGNWHYDSVNKTLTIGSLKLYIEREVDWEASPRVHTIVFAGLNSAGETVWGKLKKS